MSALSDNHPLYKFNRGQCVISMREIAVAPFIQIHSVGEVRARRIDNNKAQYLVRFEGRASLIHCEEKELLAYTKGEPRPRVFFAKDGTLMNMDGTRNIFDDVDQ